MIQNTIADSLVERGYTLANECDHETRDLIHAGMIAFQEGLATETGDKFYFFDVATHILTNACELMFRYVNQETRENDSTFKEFEKIIKEIETYA